MAPLSGTHRLPAELFDSLAEGYGDAEAVSALRAAQFSKHLVLIRAALNAIRGPRGRGLDTTAFRAGYDLLVAVQERSPGTVTEVLTHPQVGAWAAWCLRRLGNGGTPASAVPLEVDLGHLAAIAAAAAIRAGLRFEILIPTRDQTVMLPTLGLASLEAQAPWGLALATGGASEAAITAGATRVVVPAIRGADAPGWRALRRLRADAEGLRIEVFLDDMDPFRDCQGLRSAAALDADAIQTWQRALGSAWSLLSRDHPRHAVAMAAGLASIVPLATRGSPGMTSATLTDGFGAVAAAPVAEAAHLAEILVHEFQHAKLGALLDLFTLYEGPEDERFYSPWRDDPRPLDGLLQGAYAFLAVTDFWRVHRTVAAGGSAAAAHFEFARWRSATRAATSALTASGRLSAIGHRFVNGMRATLRPWLDAPVPAEPLGLAEDAAADHWTSWRLHNLVPDPDGIAKLASAWLAGQSLPDGGPLGFSVTNATRASVRSARLRLMSLRLRDPHHFAGRMAQPEGLAAEVPGASIADVALVSGDDAAAARAYLDQVAGDPDSLAAWAGLALALRGRGPAAHALRSHPEAVLAVHRRLRALGGAPDVLELATWLAPLPQPEVHWSSGPTSTRASP